MQFRTVHFFLLTAVVATVLAMRAAAIATESELVTLMTAIAISPFTTLVMLLLGSNNRASIAAGLLSSALVWAIHLADLQMRTPATEYAWRFISVNIIHFVLPVYLATSFVAACITPHLITLARGGKTNPLPSVRLSSWLRYLNVRVFLVFFVSYAFFSVILLLLSGFEYSDSLGAHGDILRFVACFTMASALTIMDSIRQQRFRRERRRGC
jgi:hypothetical protein